MPLPTSVGLTGDRAKAAALLKQFFPAHTPQQVAAAAGMVLPHLRVNFFHGGDDLLGVDGQGVGDTHLTRYFIRDRDAEGNPTGTFTLKHDSQWVDKQFRGEGHRRFAEQLDHLDRLGTVSRIHIPMAIGSAEANARRPEEYRSSGFYTWPRYGFNGTLHPHHLEDLSPEMQQSLRDKPQDLHSLFATEGGPEEWQQRGQQVFDLNFDLAPNSEHRKRFKEYHAKREAKAARVADPTGPTAGAGTPVSGGSEAGAGGPAAGDRYAAKTNGNGRVLRRLIFRYKQEQAAKRSGVLLPIEGPVRDQILSLANKIPDHLLTGNGRETDPHLTLLYGLHHPDPEAVRRLFSNAEGKIGFRLGKISVFKNPDFDVVKLEVHSPDAHRANALLKTLPHTSTFPQYNPHITLGYVKSGEGDAIAKQLGSVEAAGESDKVIFSDPERNHTHLPIGSKEQYRRGGKVLKYSTEPVEAHPSVRGFQLEHALRRAISDPETSSDLKSLSHTLLTKGVERSDAAYGINDEVQGLPDTHWLKKAGYNWLAVPHKLHLDAAVGHAIAAVNRTVGDDRHPMHSGGREAIAHYIENPGDEVLFGTHPEATGAAQEAAELLLKHHSYDDLLESIERHHTRRITEIRRDRQGLSPEIEQQMATDPKDSDDPNRYAAKGKNPEGGLTVAEARRQGVRAGSETAAEAKKAGGFSKIEGKTQKRRKSFCARACGQAKQFPKAAKDPESRLRKALRIWGCRCSSKNSAEEQAEKYAKEKPNYSPLISHAAAVLDNPDLGAVGAFADHLAEHYPDHPLTQALHQWINGAAARDTIMPHLRGKTPHQVVGPWSEEAAGHNKPVDMGVVPSDRHNIPDDHRAFQKFKGNAHWTEMFPMTAGGSFSRVPKSKRKVSSAEVAQHLFDTGGLPSLVYGVVGAQYWHPERQAAREAGTRSREVTFFSTTQQPVKYQSPALSEFITAVRQIRSDNQEVRRKIAEEQYKRLGLKATVRDAIADWPHSASANTAQAVEHNGDLDKVRAAAALYGIQTNSPQLLLFHEHPEGEDLLHKFDVMGSAEKLRQQLDAAGLPERTLSPTPNGWSVFFFDPKGQLQPKLSAFTQQTGYNLETSRGTGERIGDGQQAEADRGNRADYRKFIRQYEKQQGIQ